jgi:hypothetical protein
VAGTSQNATVLAVLLRTFKCCWSVYAKTPSDGHLLPLRGAMFFAGALTPAINEVCAGCPSHRVQAPQLHLLRGFI